MKIGDDIRHRPSKCPNCGAELDTAAQLCGDDEEAGGLKPGDITICINCSHICAFDDDHKLRNLTDQEIRDVAGDPRIIAAQKSLAEMRTDYERLFGRPWRDRGRR